MSMFCRAGPVLLKFGPLAKTSALLATLQQVVRLGVDRSGALVASAATDNTVRVWDAAERPALFLDCGDRRAIRSTIWCFPRMPGCSPFSTVRSWICSKLRMGRLLRNSNSGSYMKASRSCQTTAFMLAAIAAFCVSFHGMVMAPGRCSSYGRETVRSGCWLPRQEAGIWFSLTRPDLRSQFILSEGRVSGPALEMPGAVEEIAFGHSGARAYFRTARWTHRVSLGCSWSALGGQRFVSEATERRANCVWAERIGYGKSGLPARSPQRFHRIGRTGFSRIANPRIVWQQGRAPDRVATTSRRLALVAAQCAYQKFQPGGRYFRRRHRLPKRHRDSSEQAPRNFSEAAIVATAEPAPP